MNTRAATTPVRPTVDEPEASALKLLVVLARAFASVAVHAQADVAQHDLTPTEFGVLELLYQRGPILLREIKQRVLVSSGGTTFLVDRLEERGFVERRDCPGDRRARYAALTPAGEKLVASMMPTHARAIAHAMSGLTVAEQREATALLKKLGVTAKSLDPLATAKPKKKKR